MILATPIDGVAAGVAGALFACLVALFGVATKLMIQAAKNSDDRYQGELARRDEELARKQAELDAAVHDRDYWYRVATGKGAEP